MRQVAKLLITSVTFAFASLGSCPATAADTVKLPSPINIVVPYTPGGAVDTLARLVAKQMATDTGVNFVVENKPGAGGAIAATFVARARPDGRTLLMGSTNTGILPIINDKLQFDPIKDFEPVSDVAENIIVLLANKNFPANNLTETVELIRKDPGKYNFASPGVGTLQQLALVNFLNKLKLDVVPVPYKGSSPAMADTSSGIVPLATGGIAPALPFLEDGSIKVLGIANPNDGMFDDVSEVEGVQYFQDIQKDSAVQSWIGLFAPAGVDSAVLDTLHDAVQKVVTSDAFKEKVRPLGMAPNVSSRADFGKKVEDDIAFWRAEIPASAEKHK